MGVGLFIILTPSECVFLYCLRHEFEPPICDEFLFIE
jgi:hypothetical protein